MWNKENYIKTDYGVCDIRTAQQNGDWSYNTFRYIIETNDKSEWAYDVFIICHLALRDGKRWPDAAGKTYVLDHRPQTDVTRDLYISHHACSLFLFEIAQEWFIQGCDYPKRLWRPNFAGWRRYLLTGSKWSYFWYRTGTWIKPKKEYVKALDWLMAKAIEYRYG